MTETTKELILVGAFAFFAIGVGFGWGAYLSSPTQVFFTCYEDQQYVNYSNYGDHNVIQIDTYTERWRTWVGAERVTGPTEINDHNETGKRMVLPNTPYSPEEAAYFYGSPRFTRHYECERSYI